MRKEVRINLQYVDVLNQWNPFQLENGDYDPEIADIIQTVHELDDPLKLAKRIQAIYEFSFEKIISIEECRRIATDLLMIKSNQSCSL